MTVNEVKVRFAHFKTAAEAYASPLALLPGYGVATLGYEFSSEPNCWLIIHEAAYWLLRRHPNARFDLFWEE
jgi:hypothetical protein